MDRQRKRRAQRANDEQTSAPKRRAQRQAQSQSCQLRSVCVKAVCGACGAARRILTRALYLIGSLLMLLFTGMNAFAGWGLGIIRRAAKGMRGAWARHMTGQLKTERMRRALSLILAVSAAVSACMAGSIVLRTIRTRALNRELSAQFVAYSREEAQEVSPVLQETEDVVESEEAIPALSPAPILKAQQEEQEREIRTIAPQIVRTTRYQQIGGDALAGMEALHERNRDLVAWLNIPDVIDLPVVYKDNEYYLKRDFDKRKSDAGTIFLDVNHPFREKTQTLLLHGHNMKDGTMFGRLTQYLTDDSYIRNHGFIDFSTLWSREQYVVFALLNVSLDPTSADFFNYFTHSTFASDDEFDHFIRQMQLRSEYAVPIDVRPSDALLLLSTCLGENRLVIAARRMREGETKSELRSIIRLAQRQ